MWSAEQQKCNYNGICAVVLCFITFKTSPLMMLMFMQDSLLLD